jgi:D-beta-D-heptose 7-phosphate kinase/D-beta-D-heptose 1-phosphate adenosyltransferase
MQKLDFSTASILVFGDLMLDKYWYGDTSRISPEAPVPVVHVQGAIEHPGGSGNVAMNITALGAKASLFAVCGEDESGEHTEKILASAGVDNFLLHLPDWPTITKLRVLSTQQQLLRLDFEQKLPVAASTIMDEVISYLPRVRALILSDYGKGTLSDIPRLISHAREQQVPVLIDPKVNDFERYRGATIITPNLKEFTQVVGACHSQAELERKGQALIAEYDLQALLVTQGKEGMTLLQRNGGVFKLSTQAREVFDVTGAGDTVIAVLATAMAAGYSLPRAIQLSNTAAGIVVSKLGTATVGVHELQHASQLSLPMTASIVGLHQLLSEVQAAKATGHRIVMTNGCFDLLHPGHMTYLEEARSLGDKLIVAVNDDESVKAQNKGEDRPINPLDQRMAVLAGLSAVDWVVPFSGSTPLELIKQIVPDVLVKGGDWRSGEVVGGDIVKQAGGEVKFLPFRNGYSTTNIIKNIRGEA